MIFSQEVKYEASHPGDRTFLFSYIWECLVRKSILNVYVLDGHFEHMEVGTEMHFAVEDGEKGPQASTVRPVGKHHS